MWAFEQKKEEEVTIPPQQKNNRYSCKQWYDEIPHNISYSLEDGIIRIDVQQIPTKIMKRARLNENDVKEITEKAKLILDSKQFFGLLHAGFGGDENIRIRWTLCASIDEPEIKEFFNICWRQTFINSQIFKEFKIELNKSNIDDIERVNESLCDMYVHMKKETEKIVTIKITNNDHIHELEEKIKKLEEKIEQVSSKVNDPNRNRNLINTSVITNYTPKSYEPDESLSFYLGKTYTDTMFIIYITLYVDTDEFIMSAPVMDISGVISYGETKSSWNGTLQEGIIEATAIIGNHKETGLQKIYFRFPEGEFSATYNLISRKSDGLVSLFKIEEVLSFTPI